MLAGFELLVRNEPHQLSERRGVQHRRVLLVTAQHEAKECQLPKLDTGVRLPSPFPFLFKDLQGIRL
jgi:hypothetical protein